MSAYTVTGPNAVDGHRTGETYEADYDHVKEARLIAGGHIARALVTPDPRANSGNNNDNAEEGAGESADAGEA